MQSSETPDGCHLSRTFVPDAGDGVLQGFDDRHHVMAIGMQQMCGITHNADMAFPENEITALQMIKACRHAQ
jgi:hypothetical protein